MSAEENAGGWPDPTKPGTPLNPDRAGWHWLQYGDDVIEPCRWISGQWADGAGFCEPVISNPLWRYHGPVLTPAEIAAREAAAWCAGRDAAASEIDDPHDDSEMRSYARFFIGQIRALTPPAAMAAALDAVVRGGDACADRAGGGRWGMSRVLGAIREAPVTITIRAWPDYMAASVTHAERPHEDWTRGQDLADGPRDEATLQRIVEDVLAVCREGRHGR